MYEALWDKISWTIIVWTVCYILLKFFLHKKQDEILCDVLLFWLCIWLLKLNLTFYRKCVSLKNDLECEIINISIKTFF